jgi:hypothetical protein
VSAQGARGTARRGCWLQLRLRARLPDAAALPLLRRRRAARAPRAAAPLSAIHLSFDQK